jgi:hypothetical protein
MELICFVNVLTGNLRNVSNLISYNCFMFRMMIKFYVLNYIYMRLFHEITKKNET